MSDLLSLLLTALRSTVRRRNDVVLENLLLRHQLAVLTRTGRRPKLHARDRRLWACVRRCWSGWRRHLLFVQPETVIRWHRQGWRLFWRWKSRSQVGRPRLSPEVREWIATMSRENPLWGSERIRGELLKLGSVVSKRSIRRYRSRGQPHPPSQNWRTFLANHASQLWAADLFTVQTLTFKTLHVNVTANPTAAWVWRQLIEATPWGHRPRFLIRDRDHAFGGEFRERATRLGIETLLTPVRAPRANAVAERAVRTFRNDCLDHLIVLNERHLRAVLREFLGL